jgi:hypothetical protein
MPRKKTVPKKKEHEQVWIQTGSTLMDLAAGGGVGLGYPAGKIINIIGDSQSGKCGRDMYVLSPDKGMYRLDNEGHNRPMGESPFESCLYLQSNTVKSDVFWKECVHKTIKITTHSGFVMEGTPDHKVLVMDSNGCLVMHKLSDMTKDDHAVIAVGTNCFPCQSNGNVDNHIASFLGYYVAKGSRAKHFVTISSHDPKVRDLIEQSVLSGFPLVDKHITNINGKSVVIHRKEFYHIIDLLLDSPNEFTAQYKYVPRCVLSGSKEAQIAFLQALIDCDSYLSSGTCLEYSTASEVLAKQVQLMLLNFGVFASRREKNGAKISDKIYNHTYHHIFISGSDLVKYANVIGSQKYNFHDLKRHRDILDHNHRYDKIEKIDKLNYPEGTDVFDVHIPEGHMFWSNGFVNHNTFLCCEIIASAYHRYEDRLRWVYDDSESGFTFNTENLYGFEIMPEDQSERFHSGTVQELYGNVRLFLESLMPDEFGIYVCDTLDGLSSEENDKIAEKHYKEFKKKRGASGDDETETKSAGSYRMESAKFMSQEFFRTLTDIIQDKQCLLIFVSQIRHNVDPISRQKWTRAGGKALDFYSYANVWLRSITAITRSGRAVGSVVEASFKKLKAPRPYRDCTFTFLYDYGLDDVGSNVDFLYDIRGKNGLINKSKKGTVLQWDEDGEKMSRSELIQHIEDNSLERELAQRVIDKWEQIEADIKVERKPKYGANTNGRTKKETPPDGKGDATLTRRRRAPGESSEEVSDDSETEEKDQD